MAFLRSFDDGPVGKLLRAMAEKAAKDLPDYVPWEEFKAMRAEHTDEEEPPPDPEHAEVVAAAVDAMLVG